MTTTWTPDVLGDPYEQLTIPLGDDPDEEGTIEAVLVRRTPPPEPVAAVLYVHGFNDYFFQTDLADFFTDRGIAFYALDLRKCGRARQEGHTAHYVSDLRFYDTELDRALLTIRDEVDGLPVVLAAHSTGGLIVPLWLDRRNSRPGGVEALGVVGVVLNSPWFDLQGPAWMRSVGTQAVRVAARVRPHRVLQRAIAGAYGQSLHVSAHGEWDFDVTWKSLGGLDVTFGWLNAVRRGQARLHRGLDIGVPSLVLRSTATRISLKYRPEVDAADAILDVKQIARWAGCLGDAVTVRPIAGARHDVFLSQAGPRQAAYDVLADWLTSLGL